METRISKLYRQGLSTLSRIQNFGYGSWWINIKHYSDSNYIFKFHIYNESTKIAEASFGGNLNTMYMMELNISSYAVLSILQVILETEFYNDASGSDSDPTWSTSAFNGWIYQIAVA